MAYPALKVYFDSGVHHARRGAAPRATLGFAIFEENARRGSQPLTVSLAGSWLGGAIGYWHQEGQAFLARVGEAVASYPPSRGSQLYDLVAAHGALLHLKVNEYRGRVRMLGDRKEVIEFLNGRGDALHLEVAGQDIARRIRGHIRDVATYVGELTWEWVSTKENWADPLLKSLDRDSGR